MAGGSSINVLEQFELHPVLGGLGEALSLSQAPVFMAVACVIVLAFLHFGMKPAAVVPGRLQAAAEICYEFIHNLAVDTIDPLKRGRVILAKPRKGVAPISCAASSSERGSRRNRAMTLL